MRLLPSRMCRRPRSPCSAAPSDDDGCSTHRGPKDALFEMSEIRVCTPAGLLLATRVRCVLDRKVQSRYIDLIGRQPRRASTNEDISRGISGVAEGTGCFLRSQLPVGLTAQAALSAPRLLGWHGPLAHPDRTPPFPWAAPKAPMERHLRCFCSQATLQPFSLGCTPRLL